MRKVFVKLLILIVLVIIVYSIFISLFIYPCKTQGMSMYPTIVPNEIKFTNRWKIITNKEKLNRGDIVVIEEPDVLYIKKEEYSPHNVMAIYNDRLHLNPFRKRWMKRVIAIEGDHVRITEDRRLYINGEIYREDYIEEGYTNIEYNSDMPYMYIDIVVPQDSIYVMGDNRLESIDSRSFGCVPLEKVYSILLE